MRTNRHFGYDFFTHTIQVPWDPFNAPDGETFELFAREIVAPDKHDAPAIVYLQGGPGSPAPQPLNASGVVGEMLKEFRVILLDQRGTGNSHRIDSANPADAKRLNLLRQEYIVEDAEALRKHLNIDKWSLFGQSFGGFCITAYLSRHPESVEHAYLTGGLPTLEKSVDDLYRTTFAKLQVRHDRFYREYPWAEDRIREICAHLEDSAEILPTGERLSARRFRTIGINLGRGVGFHSLAYLLENPFHAHGGEKRLRTDFLTHFFPGAQRLMELADSLTEIKTVCACGRKATVNARIDASGRIITQGDQVFLGGNDSYVAMCHKCWKQRISEQSGK